METNLRLALMIDGDNAQAALLPQILAEVSKYGTLIIRRVYGDWSGSNMNSWKEILHVHALDAAQQFSYTKGKNATDIGLTIGAMDILYKYEVDGFCIISSDSDYTPLAIRIRQQNMFVLGIGKNITPNTFVDACDVFVYTENLHTVAKKQTHLKVQTPIMITPKIAKTVVPKPIITTQKETQVVVKNATMPKRLKELLHNAFNSVVQEDGWANLGAVGSTLRQLDPEFDPSTYGHKQLSQLVQAFPNLINVRKSNANGGSATIHIRLKATSNGQTK